jgi:hypothetical protein
MTRKLTGQWRHRRRDQRPQQLLRILLIPVLAATFLSGLAPGWAHADGNGSAEGARRWQLGIAALSSHIGADDPPPNPQPGAIYVDEVGGGIALHLGYALSPAFLLRLYVSGAVHETSNPDVDFGLGGGTIEGLYLFRPGQHLRPYILGGLGGFKMSSDQASVSFEATGGGAVFGTGLQYLLGRVVALDFCLRGEWINWDETKATIELHSGDSLTTTTPVDESGGAAKITFGLVLHL